MFFQAKDDSTSSLLLQAKNEPAVQASKTSVSDKRSTSRGGDKKEDPKKDGGLRLAFHMGCIKEKANC